MLTRKTLTFLVPITAAAALASLGGCELIASVDRTKIDAGTGGTTSQGGTGGTTTSTGGGGAENCADTCMDADPDDCIISECDSNDACIDNNRAVGEDCTDSANSDAKVCDGAGMCVQCNDDTNCSGTTPVCDMATKTCVAQHCMNGVQDADETDLNCGGADCNPCANDLGCALATDCVSGFCDMDGGPGGAGGGPATGTCRPCGGHTDCGPLDYCDPNDNSGTCKADEANGFDCSAAALGSEACSSGNCVDGFCCDNACGSACDACSAALTGGTDGSCLPTSAGTVCRAAVPGGCDVQEVCDGTAVTCPADAFQPMNTVCRPAVDAQCDLPEVCSGSSNACPSDAFASSATPCADGVAEPICNPDFCDGAGTCNNVGPAPDTTACTQNGGTECLAGVCVMGGGGGAGGGGGGGGGGGS